MDAASAETEQAHPLRERVRCWAREIDPAGYRFVAGRYGWYRQDELPFGVVTLGDQVDAASVPAAIVECRCHFPVGGITLWVEGRKRDAKLRPALRRAGAREAFEACYMAHAGPGSNPPQPLPAGLRLVMGGEAELDDFVRIKQQAFMATEYLPSEQSLRAERARRLGELRHSGGMCLVYRGDEAVAGASFFRVGPDWFLNLLVTRVPYRGRGIGRALVDAVVERGYRAGAEAVVVVPDPAVERLYRRAGFAEEVLWRRAYQIG